MLLNGNPTRRGGVAITLAAALPVVAYIGIIATDWARLIHYRITTQDSARAGALYAADPTRVSESPHPNVSAAALAHAPTMTQTPTVSATPTTIAGRPAVKVTVSLWFTPIVSLPGGPPDQAVARSVLIPILAATTQESPQLR